MSVKTTQLHAAINHLQLAEEALDTQDSELWAYEIGLIVNIIDTIFEVIQEEKDDGGLRYE